jgi:hypothetical protein
VLVLAGILKVVLRINPPGEIVVKALSGSEPAP